MEYVLQSGERVSCCSSGQRGGGRPGAAVAAAAGTCGEGVNILVSEYTDLQFF